MIPFFLNWIRLGRYCVGHGIRYKQGQNELVAPFVMLQVYELPYDWMCLLTLMTGMILYYNSHPMILHLRLNRVLQQTFYGYC